MKTALLFLITVISVLSGAVVADALPEDSNSITGAGVWGSIKKHTKKAAKKVTKTAKKAVKETKKAAKKVEKEVKKAAKKAGKEAKKLTKEAEKFGKKAKNQAGKLVKEVEEIKKLPGAVQDLSKKVESEIRKVPKTIKDLPGDIKGELEKWAKSPEKVYKDLIKKVKNEINAQKDTIKNLAQGKVCSELNKAYDGGRSESQAEKFVLHELVPSIKSAVRPQVAAIVATAAAPINALPVAGQVIYAAVVPAATEWGSDYAAKKGINEALDACD